MMCWEIVKCAEEVREKCPAYPDNGMDCWKVTGTMCAQGKYEKATLTEKLTHCMNCEFYKQYAHKF